MDTNNSNYEDATISVLSKAFKEKKVSPVEIVQSLLKRISSENKKLNAYITVCEETALSEAKIAEKEIYNSEIRSPLHGIPLAVKDLIYTKNLKTTMGSGVYKDFIPQYDATVVRKMKDSGGIIIGKTNTHELAYGASGDYSFFGPTKNPFDTTKIPGGSSSGSAVAVSASLAIASLGTDTGGSVRIPAAFCNIVGMKPTMGSVSTYGTHSLSLTLENIGPLTKDVTGNAMMLNHLIGKDPQDPYSSRRKPEDFTARIGNNIKGTIIGLPFDYIRFADDEILDNVMKMIHVFESLGAQVKTIQLPNMAEVLEISAVTAYSEVYANHRDIALSNDNLLGEKTRERILAGAKFQAFEYINAQKKRHHYMMEFDSLFQDVDLVITPTTPIMPQNIGQKEVCIQGVQEQVLSVLTRFTLPYNLLGLPSLSLPVAFSKAGLPIGIQLIGKKYDEANLYRYAYALEQSLSHSPGY